MNNKLSLWWVILAGWINWAAMPAALTPAKPEPCELYGAVYIEPVAAFADYRVFVQEVEAFADLVVYKEDTEVYADEVGHWYFTQVKSAADFSIHLEAVEAFAEFDIAYTAYRTAAGCNP